MYEETDKKFFSKNLILLILKLIFLAIFIFIICWLFLKTKKNNVVTEVEQDYVNNINMMKEAATEYFVKEKLPKNVGKSSKLTLEEMLNQKLLIDFTNNGKNCNVNDSFVQATKTADNNYALKVYLKCQDKEDYIITTIENKDIICNNCQNTNSSNSKVNSSTTNTNSNNNTTEKVEEKNNSIADSTTNKKPSTTNKNNNSSSSSNKVVNVTQKIVTKVSYNYNYNYYNLCSSCNKKPTTEKNTKYYKLYKYGEWQNGYLTGDNYETKCESQKTYEYCKTKNNYYYGACYIPAGTTKEDHNFNLSISYDEDNAPVLKKSEFFTNINEYSTYLNIPSVRNKTLVNVFPELNAQMMMNSALKDSNLKFYSVKIDKTNGKFNLNYTIRIKNKDNVTPYYSKYLGYNLYFIPIKITLAYKDKNSCVVDTEANASKYQDYLKYNGKIINVCKHREKNYVWVKEQDLNSYLNNGWQKTGETKTVKK